VASEPDSRSPRQQLEVTPGEAARRLQQGARLLDVREASELERASITGACHVPLREIEDRLDEIQELAEEGVDLLVLCHHGQRSLRAALALHALGVQSVRSITGGIDRWSVEVDTNIPRYSR
jgi:rhodanese-related sulfurtransferase